MYHHNVQFPNFTKDPSFGVKFIYQIIQYTPFICPCTEFCNSLDCKSEYNPRSSGQPYYK